MNFIIAMFLIISLLTCFGSFAIYNMPGDRKTIKIVEALVMVISIVMIYLTGDLSAYTFAFNSSIDVFKIGFYLDANGLQWSLFLIASAAISGIYGEYDKSEWKSDLKNGGLLLAAIGLVISSNLYTFLFCSMILNLALLSANVKTTPEMKVSALNYFCRKILTDFILIICIVILSLYNSNLSFQFLEESFEDPFTTSKYVAAVIMIFWFFIRLRLFPFLSFKQSYYSSLTTKFKVVYLGVYIPAILFSFIKFAPYIERIDSLREIVFYGGSLSVIIYSILMLCSHRSSMIQTNFIYSFFGLIPMMVGVGATTAISYNIMFISMLLVLMNFCMHKTLTNEAIWLHPRSAAMIIAISILLIGIPCLGISSIRFEVLWSAFNLNDRLLPVSSIILGFVLQIIMIFRILYYLVLNYDANLKWGAFRIFTLIFYIGFFIVIGIALSPVEFGIGNEMILAALSAPIMDLRIIYAPTWVSELSIGLNFGLPLLVMAIAFYLTKSNLHKSSVFFAFKGKDHYFVQNYEAIRGINLSALNGGIKLLRVVSDSIFGVTRRDYAIFKQFSKFIDWCNEIVNRIQVTSSHGFMLQVLLMILLGFCIILFFHLGGRS